MQSHKVNADPYSQRKVNAEPYSLRKSWNEWIYWKQSELYWIRPTYENCDCYKKHTI